MGGSESKVNFRRAIVELETGSQGDEAFWESFWASDGVSCAQDVWALVPSAEVRALREEHPSLLATLIYKGGNYPRLYFQLYYISRCGKITRIVENSSRTSRWRKDCAA